MHNFESIATKIFNALVNPTMPKKQPQTTNKKQYCVNKKYTTTICDDELIVTIDGVQQNITDKWTLGLDNNEFIYGLMPELIKTARLYFVPSGIKTPKFFHSPNMYKPCVYADGTQYVANSSFALALLVLFFKKVVTNELAVNFINKFGTTNDACHCYRGMIDLYRLYILQNKNNEFKSHNYTKSYTHGAYILYSMTQLKPSKPHNRSSILSTAEWNQILIDNNYKCMLCGSIQGQPHSLYPTSTTKLEQGHINPILPLTVDNCKPVCCQCNRKTKNNYHLEYYSNTEPSLYIEYQYIKSQYPKQEDFQKLVDEIKGSIYK